MFDCNKCEREETEYCSSCYETYCKPSNWKRKEINIVELIKHDKDIDVRKCNK